MVLPEMDEAAPDMELLELGGGELLTAIKTLEEGELAADEFPLSFDLPEREDEDAAEDKIRLHQARLERRRAFLERRLRIYQARALGKRVSQEVADTFDKCLKAVKKDGSGRGAGLKSFLKRVETTATLQANAAARTVPGPSYFNPGTSTADPSKTASIGIPPGTLAGLEDTAGALRTHLSVVKRELDSDATLSSSGAESNDEAVIYNNPHQQPMPIEKRALWTYQRARASIASRWCWLQAQVQELEYKIRQHTDLYNQIRSSKGPVELEGEPAAYEGPLPGEDLPYDPALETCARIRPLKTETFKKRKLLQMHNLHIATTKAAKPADIQCDCNPLIQESCAVCTGRGLATEPAVPLSTLSSRQRLARCMPYYHPVLSDIRDVPASEHLAALSSRGWFVSRCGRARRRAGTRHVAATSTSTAATSTATQPPPKRLKRGRPPLSRKIRERERPEKEEETNTSTYETRRSLRPSTETRQPRSNSFDIDNIVIPQSMAANTRPQILQYKEIITPKWRVLEIPETSLNNGAAKSPLKSDSEDEDVSEFAISRRHSRAEVAERSKYITSRHNNLAVNVLPINNTNNITDGEIPRAEVRPYSPRRFPLAESAYHAMVRSPHSPHSTHSPHSPASPHSRHDSSTLTPPSPRSPRELVFDADDDDDWAPPAR